MKYRKLPVIVEAILWDCTIAQEEELKKMGCIFYVCPNPDFLEIQTLEGPMVAAPWDMIIQGVEGEFYPCKPSVFLKTYERA